MSAVVNDIFSISVLLTLTTSSLNLCMLGFSVVEGVSLVDFFRQFLILFLQMLQIFNLCYMGMRLTECVSNIIIKWANILSIMEIQLFYRALMLEYLPLITSISNQMLSIKNICCE